MDWLEAAQEIEHDCIDAELDYIMEPDGALDISENFNARMEFIAKICPSFMQGQEKATFWLTVNKGIVNAIKAGYTEFQASSYAQYVERAQKERTEVTINDDLPF